MPTSARVGRLVGAFYVCHPIQACRNWPRSPFIPSATMTWRSLLSRLSLSRLSAVPADVFAKAEQKGYDSALAWAKRRVPTDLQPALHLLRANRDRADWRLWSTHLNAYLATLGVAPIRLAETSEPLVHRLGALTAPGKIDGPLVSVIMCAHNAQSTIDMAARSILNQRWRNLELIIVDDASMDTTPSMIRRLAECDPRVRDIRTGVNVGPYVGRNIAVQLARGSYITCHDADDWAHPDRIADQFRFARANGLAVAIASMLRMDADGRFTRVGPPTRNSHDGLLRQCFVSAFFDAEFFRNSLGYWDSVRFGADSEMIARARRLDARLVGTEQKLSMLCLDRESSLINDPFTGLQSNGRLSVPRRQYMQHYQQWHDRGAVPMPFPQAARVFPIPQQMEVPSEKVIAALESHRPIDPAL